MFIIKNLFTFVFLLSVINYPDILIHCPFDLSVYLLGGLHLYTCTLAVNTVLPRIVAPEIINFEGDFARRYFMMSYRVVIQLKHLMNY